ncbi:alkene reductase [Croceivirga sp. JEA036]|uniref:alkene reductase n=1 Tax=Croceivirga sp. JEA036 TaxID=2721162 RepID=UPI00143C770B|nr:alkene reductase [Croceivirga sp. JEA036]NJB35695.1 alkene reductase [Croceivirga sp. JEA036]
MKNTQPLLQPLKQNGLYLNNRVVMAPMTRSRADNPELKPTADLHVPYYKQRSGAGLIITEGSPVSKEAIGYVFTPGIFTQEQVNGWRKVTTGVHENGGKIFIQLWHVGRISHPDFHEGQLPLAPSAINPEAQVYTPEGFKDTVTPKAMTKEDIDKTISDFKKAAENAMLAGFDGVEIHSSNGYLFHQFFNKCSNVRTDEYGGSIENRVRFFFEVLEAVKSVMPASKIGVRFNPSMHGMMGMSVDEETIPTFEYIINRLSKYNLAYVHLSEPFTDVSDVPFAVTQIAKHFRPIYSGNLIINAGFDQEKGNEVIETGEADMVAFGKPYISNPDLVDRFKHNIALADWDKDTFYTQGKEGYLDYPTYKEEKQEA